MNTNLTKVQLVATLPDGRIYDVHQYTKDTVYRKDGTLTAKVSFFIADALAAGCTVEIKEIA